MSREVGMTLLGAAPAPVSARPTPMRIGLPLCADAPESERNATINAAAHVRSAFPMSLVIVSSLTGKASLCLALCSQSPGLLVHFIRRHDAPVVPCIRVFLPH